MTTFKIHGQPDKTMAQVKPNPFMIYLLWVITTTIGWWAGAFDLNAEPRTYMDIFRLVPIYLVDGLLIGLIVGVGQAMILRRLTNLNWAWVSATILGYGLTFFAGLIVSVSIPSIIILLRDGHYLLPWVEPSITSIWLNMDDIFWGGFLIGVIQWPVLKKIIPNPNWNKAILWVLANWFVLGSNVFVRAFTHESPLASFQMALMGVVMGVITGGILLAFLSNSDVRE